MKDRGHKVSRGGSSEPKASVETAGFQEGAEATTGSTERGSFRAEEGNPTPSANYIWKKKIKYQFLILKTKILIP